MKFSTVVAFLACQVLTFESLRAIQEDTPDQFDPATTHAVIVGVLSWEDQSVTTFPAENRWDQKLYDMLIEQGVDKQNAVLLLDKQATGDKIRDSLTKIAKRAKPGDSLIFYYAGHGVPSKNGVCFLNYDATDDNMFAVSEISEILTESFKGKRVMLFADCCFSGGLAQTAEELAQKGFETASITSAASSNTSTSQWTFTHTLVETLRGNPAADRNGDKAISIDEVAAEIADAMKYVEGQQHGQSRFKISEDFLFSNHHIYLTEEIPDPYELYEYVQVRDNGRWRPARIVGITGLKSELIQAEIQDYSTRRTLALKPDNVRKYQFRSRQRRAVHEKPTETLSEEDAKARASVNEKYSNLLKKIRVEHDYQTYSAFNDYGEYPATEYAGHTDLPKGYWVYVYPHWYIWEMANDDQ